jgi:hypothetical protein
MPVRSTAASQLIPAAASDMERETIMRLTIDSTEPLDEVIKVLGAMYGVTLVVSDAETGAPPPVADIDTPPPAAEEKTAPPSSPAAEETPTPRRKRPSRRRAPRAGRTARDRVDNAEIRAWARENGYTVSDRGRVPANIVAAYREAQGSGAES